MNGPARAGDKQPHLDRRQDGALMALAGLWEHWLGADGSELETMAILTVAASGPMLRIHDRMPLILEAPHFEAWLDCTSGSTAGITGLLNPAAAQDLDIVAVNRMLNNPRNDSAEVQEPIELPLR